MTSKPIVPGLYDIPLTVALERLLAELDESRKQTKKLDPSDAPVGLSRLLFDRIRHALASQRGDKPADRVAKQIALANKVLTLLEKEAPDSGAVVGDHVAQEALRLLAVFEPPISGLVQPAEPIRPEIPLGPRTCLQLRVLFERVARTECTNDGDLKPSRLCP